MQSIPNDMEFDPNSTPPSYHTDDSVSAIKCLLLIGSGFPDLTAVYVLSAKLNVCLESGDVNLFPVFRTGSSY